MDFSTKWRNGLNSKDAEPENPAVGFWKKRSPNCEIADKITFKLC